MWFVYFLRCSDNSLYCGITNNVDKRVATHNAGKGAKYTKPEFRRPVKVVYLEEHPSKIDALKAEYKLKKLKKAEKEKLVYEYEATKNK